METIVFDGKEEARKIRGDLKKEAAQLGLRPALAVILVGDNPGSLTYVKRKRVACEELGFKFELSHLPETAGEEDIKERIISFNNDQSVNGIILQLPLPFHLSPVSLSLTNLVAPNKDIDGLTPNSPFTPPVALAVLHVLRTSHIKIESANAVVLGRGQTAGKPISKMLEKSGSKVTVVHSQTPADELTSLLLTADIVVSCVGKPNLIKGGMIKNGAVIIGVGLSRTNSRVDEKGVTFSTPNRLQGDLDEHSLLGKAFLVTPTPGGIGPLTVAFLLKNLMSACRDCREHG